jgi:hypothetical protein
LLEAWQGGAGTSAQAAELWATGDGGKPPLSMAVEPRALTWAEKGKGKAATLGSSPVVRNPFRHQSKQDIYHMCNADAAWSVVQGLAPTGDEHHPAGYTPVGGVTYKVASPNAKGLSAGRRLFSQYFKNMDSDAHTQQSPPQTGLRSAQQLAEQAPFAGGAAHACIQPGLQGLQINEAAHTCEHQGQWTGSGDHIPFAGVAVHVHTEPGLQGPQIDRADCMCELPGQWTGLPDVSRC